MGSWATGQSQQADTQPSVLAGHGKRPSGRQLGRHTCRLACSVCLQVFRSTVVKVKVKAQAAIQRLRGELSEAEARAEGGGAQTSSPEQVRHNDWKCPVPSVYLRGQFVNDKRQREDFSRASMCKLIIVQKALRF